MRCDTRGRNSLVHASLMLFPVEVEPCCVMAQRPSVASPMAHGEQVFLRTSTFSPAAAFQKTNQSLTSCVMLCADEGTREGEKAVST